MTPEQMLIIGIIAALFLGAMIGKAHGTKKTEQFKKKHHPKNAGITRICWRRKPRIALQNSKDCTRNSRMITHIMTDLESLDTRPTAAITQIAAVAFNSGGIIGEFAFNVYKESCENFNLTTSEKTLKWYKDNNYQIYDPQLQTVNLPTVMHLLNDYLNKFSKIMMWSKGTNFEFPILENIYQKLQEPEIFDIQMPWQYYQIMDMRTVRYLYPNIPTDPNPHNALPDAINQANFVIKALGKRLDTITGEK